MFPSPASPEAPSPEPRAPAFEASARQAFSVLRFSFSCQLSASGLSASSTQPLMPAVARSVVGSAASFCDVIFRGSEAAAGTIESRVDSELRRGRPRSRFQLSALSFSSRLPVAQALMPAVTQKFGRQRFLWCDISEPRAPSPEPRAPSPEPRAPSPEPRVPLFGFAQFFDDVLPARR